MRPNLFVPVDDGGLVDRSDAVDLVVGDEAKVVNPHLHAVRPNLSVVVDHNGEVVEQDSLEELRIINDRLEKDLRGYRLRYGALEAENAQKAEEKRDPRVERVLDYWADQVLLWGWWTQRPFYSPSHLRWKHCAARLKDKRKDGTHPYDEAYLCQVVDGAVSQQRTKKVKQAYIDAKSIFLPDNLESHYEQGHGVREACLAKAEEAFEARLAAHHAKHPSIVFEAVVAERQAQTLFELEPTAFEPKPSESAA